MSQSLKKIGIPLPTTIVIALALLGLVAITLVTIPLQQAGASCITGYMQSGNKSALFTALEKSEGRCVFHP